MGEWIEWDGGECPVSHETRVDTRFPDGVECYGDVAGFWAGGRDSWKHMGRPDNSIIAYRIVELPA